MQPQIILLKEGTDTSQGIPQLISNINACTTVVDMVRTTLGPLGQDKLIQNNRETTISNDGATVMRCLDIAHPAAKTLVDIAKSQDAEVGDGTTTVVVLAGEFLREAKTLIEEGVHPRLIIRQYREACERGVKKLESIGIALKEGQDEREILQKCAQTALNSKIINHEKGFFANMAVEAVLSLEEDMDLDLIGIKKVQGGSMTDSELIKGVAFKKCFSYAGFEQQPKYFKDPKILLLHLELELKAEKDNAEIRVKDPKQYQAIVDAEWKIIYDKLEKCVESGAQVVLSQLPIGDLATQYFADRGIFCAGRVTADDIKRVAKSCGGAVQTTVSSVEPQNLGTCEEFEEKQVGNERYNFFRGGAGKASATVVLRGGSEHFIDEAERSLHDALCIVKRAHKNTVVVGGGGAVEMELSKELRNYARTISGKGQVIVNGFARALEVIPRQVAENAGMDSTEILTQLRNRHSQEDNWFGVDVVLGGVCDTVQAAVLEPVSVKKNALRSATEAACLILSIDETVRNPQNEQQQAQGAQGGRMAGQAGSMSQKGMMGMADGLKGRGVKHMKGMGGK